MCLLRESGRKMSIASLYKATLYKETDSPLGEQKAVAPQSIPAPVRNSYLMSKGGFDVFEGLLDQPTLDLLLSEAVMLAASGNQSDVPISDGEEVRGGSPARRFLNTGGGQVQTAFYQADWLIDFLSKLCDAPVTPTGTHGTYSFYVRSGDHIFIHRDIESCDLAVITCLYDNAGPDCDGGILYLYPGRLFEPLSAIRVTPEQGAFGVRLQCGQTIIMFGGLIPHAILPVAEGQMRIVSVLCYSIPSMLAVE